MLLDRTRTYNRLPRAWSFILDNLVESWVNGPIFHHKKETKNLILKIKVFPLFRDSQPAVAESPSLLSVQQHRKWKNFLPPANFFRLVNGEKTLFNFIFSFFFHSHLLVHPFSISCCLENSRMCRIFCRWMMMLFCMKQKLNYMRPFFNPFFELHERFWAEILSFSKNEIQFDANLPQSFLFSSCNGHVVQGEW